MTTEQKTIKTLAFILAGIICLSIFSIMVRALGFVFSIIDDEYESSTETRQIISTEKIDYRKIDKLDIDMTISSLEIRRGTTLSIEKSNSDMDVRVSENSSTLKVEEKTRHFFGLHKGGTLLLTLPNSMDISKLDIDHGAGKISIDGITADNFEFDQGAGTIDVTDCTFKNTDIDGGVGKMTVRSSTLGNLDLDMGVGSIDIEAKLTGGIDIDGGVGSLDLEIIGEREDYSFSIEKGLGVITVDGENTSGTFGTGPNRLKIDGGVGTVKIKFVK